MFWSDWGNKPYIALGYLDGSHKEMVVYNTNENNQYVSWPNGLTLDTTGTADRLYWIDAKLNRVFSCIIDNCLGSIRVVVYSAQEISHPFAITVFEVLNYIYNYNYYKLWFIPIYINV